MTSGHVRPFVADDISQVADLHRRIFGVSDEWSPGLRQSYSRYFREVFLNNPWYDESLPSLVYEERNGKIGGFLGVMPRPMWMRDRLIRAAVSSQFIVERESRFELASLQLLKTFLSGPQDLSLADEANDASRSLWERLGGQTSFLFSIHWTCFLRPAQYVRQRMSQHRLLGPLAFLSAPFCHAIDSIAARVPRSPFYRAASRSMSEDLGPEALLKCSETFHRRSLRPAYDCRSLAWLLERAHQANSQRGLRKVLVRNATGEAIGWFMYYVDRLGKGEVLQIGSQKASTSEVLDHLFYHACRDGAVTLEGRMDPDLMPELLAGSGLSCQRRYWTLIHSRKPELLEAIHSGDAFLTRLEGEWCMRFQRETNG